MGVSLALIELLFEDVSLSEDQETIDQIDRLMKNISKIPLRNNPLTIFGFISQQMLIAKYEYYIKGDPTTALDNLIEAKGLVTAYKLDSLASQLDAEIDDVQKEITK